MNTYIIRCFLYALPLPMVVNVLTFMLFFFVNSTDDMAGMQLGQKMSPNNLSKNWKHQHGYDLPLLWNGDQEGSKKLSD